MLKKNLIATAFLLAVFFLTGISCCSVNGTCEDTCEDDGSQDDPSAQPAVNETDDNADSQSSVQTGPDNEGFPQNWPDDIPIMEDMSLQSTEYNPMGGFKAYFTGPYSLEEVEEYYSEVITGWTEAEPSYMPQPPDNPILMIPEQYQMSGYRDNETFEITAISQTHMPDINIQVTYNWRSPPGELPEGWPDDLPLISGMENQYSFTSANGITVHLYGPVLIQDAVDFYLTALPDWTLISNTGRGGQTILAFNRQSEILSITCFEDGDNSLLQLRWSLMD